MSKFRRTAAIAVAAGAAAVAVPAVSVGLAAPASASTVCSGVSTVYKNGLQFTLPSTHNDSHDLNCVLKNGNQGDGVKTLQHSLRDCNGQKHLQVDGKYGQNTHNAVANVQKRHHITIDGDYGPMTRKVMRWPTSTGCHLYGR